MLDVVLRIWLPTFQICFTIDEHDITRAARIAISGTKSCTCLILSYTFTSIFLHLDKIDRPIHAAFQLAHVGLESKLIVQQMEHFILLVFRTC
jgi:hypothetical protein